MAYLIQTDVGQSYMAIQVVGLDTDYSRDDRYVEWTIDGSSSGSGSIAAGSSSSDSQYFINLSPNTTYYITATVYYSSTPTSGVDSSTTFGESFTTDPAPEPDPDPEPDPRPDYFYWDTNKVSGASFNLTANEWNRLCSNINLVRNYLGYTTYSFQSVKQGDTFTASHYNEVANAINGMYEYTGYISNVSSGQTIYASQLNSLRDAINSLG